MTAQKLFDLTNRVALITGGSRGLGLPIAGNASALVAPNTSAAESSW